MASIQYLWYEFVRCEPVQRYQIKDFLDIFYLVGVRRSLHQIKDISRISYFMQTKSSNLFLAAREINIARESGEQDLNGLILFAIERSPTERSRHKRSRHREFTP